MKKIISLLLLAALVITLAACGGKPEGEDTTPTPSASEPTAAKIDIKAAVLSGPTGMGAAKLMDMAANGETANNYQFTVAASPDEITASLVNGEFQIACVPTNLAAVLYQKTAGKIQTAAVNTLGVLYMLTSGVEINEVSDLEGKTIYATNQGSTPEYILNYVLTKNGLTPGENVTVEFADADTVSAGLVSGDIEIAMLPEPKVSAVLINGKEKVRVALDMTKEWEKIDEKSTVMQGCIVVNKEFAAENHAAVDAFLNEYKESVDFIENNLETAAALCETYAILPKAAIAAKAYPNCHIVYQDGAQMKEQLSAFLQVLYEANAASVGGKMPDDGFWYE
ncbi:MAG: ABC transporter substrate-binding protein [Clostridiales bacterium]|nr:ABC transporter substrate-binding protein [Clostridiales bacterium]